MVALKGMLYFVCALWVFSTTLRSESSPVTADAGYREIEFHNGWTQIFPGGNTTCARGEEFSFFYRAGSSDAVVIDFVGGGACWSFATCNKGTAFFVDSVDRIKNRVEQNGLNGIYDHTNRENPLKDWSHVVIPYCTGDLHWGDKVQTYSKGNQTVTIFHKGAVNAERVLEWTFQKFAPQRILVTGTSAGGYASIYWLPYIQERAKNASIVQFSDGAAGIVMKESFAEILRAWNVEAHAATWIPNLNPANVLWNELSLVDLYTEIGRYYPTIMLSQFNTHLDAVQMIFYYAMGARDPEDWSRQALESMNDISQNISNFQYFYAPGEFHTILPENLFYTLSVDSVKLIDWLQTMLERANMGNIVCRECDATNA